MATAPAGASQKGADHAGVPQGQLQGGHEDRGQGERRGLDRRVREEGPLAPRRQHLLREQEELHVVWRGAAAGEPSGYGRWDSERASGWSWEERSPASLRRPRSSMWRASASRTPRGIGHTSDALFSSSATLSSARATPPSWWAPGQAFGAAKVSSVSVTRTSPAQSLPLTERSEP